MSPRFRRLPRALIGRTAVICALAFCGMLVAGAWAIGMTYYLREVHGATGIEIGLFFALWAISYIVSCHLVRPRFDRLRPSQAVAVGIAVMFCAKVTVSISGAFWVAYVCNAAYALGASLYWPMLMTWLARKRTGAGLSRRMSLYNVCWSAGATISPFLGAWLSQIDPGLPIYFAGAMWIVAAAILAGAMLLMPRIRADRSFKTGGRKAASTRDPATRLRYAAWLGAVLTFAAVGVVARMFPLWGTEVLGLEKTTVGWLLLVRTLFLSLGFAVMGAAAFWHYNSRFLVGILLVLGATLAGIVFARTIPALLPVMFVLGLLQAAAYFASMFHSTAGAERRAAALAVHETMLNLGLLAGGVVGGLVYQVLTFEHGCVLVAVLVLLGSAIQTWVCHWADRVEGRGMGANGRRAPDDRERA